MEHDKNWAAVCNHVSEGVRPIKLIYRDRNDDWQLMCGEYDHDDAGFIMICSACALEQYPEFALHQTLQPGFMAEWIDDTWAIINHDN